MFANANVQPDRDMLLKREDGVISETDITIFRDPREWPAALVRRLAEH